MLINKAIEIERHASLQLFFNKQCSGVGSVGRFHSFAGITPANDRAICSEVARVKNRNHINIGGMFFFVP